MKVICSALTSFVTFLSVGASASTPVRAAELSATCKAISPSTWEKAGEGVFNSRPIEIKLKPFLFGGKVSGSIGKLEIDGKRFIVSGSQRDNGTASLILGIQDLQSKTIVNATSDLTAKRQAAVSIESESIDSSYSLTCTAN